MWYYQAVSNIEDDVDSVQAVADVLPEWGNHNHWLSVRPGQVIVVVPLKDYIFKKAGFKCVFSVWTGHIAASSLTIKYSTAILGCGGQWLAGGVQFVAIVTDADLKLDWLSWVLYHGGTVEDCTQTELPPPLVLLT